MISGLFESHLKVSDLKRSVAFYSEVLGLDICYEDADRKLCFFWVGGVQKSMLGLWEAPEEANISQHVAFQTSKEWILHESVEHLNKHGVSSYNFLRDRDFGPMVFAWMPALSIYFNDPDGHVLEYISILPGEPKSDLGVISYEHWMELNV
ncbi:MAG: VOC family protein [Crocinitomicaceae bacterium]